MNYHEFCTIIQKRLILGLWKRSIFMRKSRKRQNKSKLVGKS